MQKWKPNFKYPIELGSTFQGAGEEEFHTLKCKIFIFYFLSVFSVLFLHR
jgi:hypothetical protein